MTAFHSYSSYFKFFYQYFKNDPEHFLLTVGMNIKENREVGTERIGRFTKTLKEDSSSWQRFWKSTELKCKGRRPALIIFLPPFSKLYRNQENCPNRNCGSASVLEMQRQGKVFIAKKMGAVPGTRCRAGSSKSWCWKPNTLPESTLFWLVPEPEIVFRLQGS